MPNIVIDTTSTDIMANMVATLLATTVDNLPIFSNVRVVDDPESFIHVSDALLGADKPEVGIVEGTLEEREGDNDTESQIMSMPFEIIVRFAMVRDIVADESAAMNKARTALEACKTSLNVDKSRGGKARLVKWGADVINGTTFRGTIRPLVPKGTPNQAFFAASLTGACAWSKP